MRIRAARSFQLPAPRSRDNLTSSEKTVAQPLASRCRTSALSPSSSLTSWAESERSAERGAARSGQADLVDNPRDE